MRGVASSKPNTQSRCFNDHLLKLQCRSQQIHFEEQQYCQVQTLCDNNAETLFIIAACLGKYAIPQHDMLASARQTKAAKEPSMFADILSHPSFSPDLELHPMIYYRQAEGAPRTTMLRS